MFDGLSIQFNTIIFIIIVAILIAFFVVLIKLIQFLSALTKTVKKTEALLSDANHTLRHVNGIAEDVNRRYFLARETFGKLGLYVVDLIKRKLDKKDEAEVFDE